MEMASSIGTSGARRIASDLGFYSSLLAFIAAAGYCAAQILQLVGVLKFPVDANLIYGFSLGISVPFVIAVIAVHHLVPADKRILTHVAIAFAVMYATYVNLNYVVQLATVIPATLRGVADDIKVLDQTPHSLFWDIDALGYICMGCSTFVLGFAFAKEFKWLRVLLFANGLFVPVIGFVYFYPHFSTALLLIGLPWIITAPGSLLLLSLFFNSERKTANLASRQEYHDGLTAR